MMARVFERLSDWVNADAALVRRGRYLSTKFLIEVGEVAWLVTVHEGRVTRVERGPFLMRDWVFAVRASEEVCTPEDTERTAAQINGARVTVMREIGHFPMSENPAQFRRYTLPVLDEIRARG
jgi:pimeloyl-ACP methyl ester carboxylesterase